MIQFNRPEILAKIPAKTASRVKLAFNLPTVMDPAMIFTHHIEVHAWIGRVYFGGIRLYWGSNPEVPTSDAYARYSSRLYARRKA